MSDTAKKTAAKADTATVKPTTAAVKLACNVDHDGQRLPEGEEVELPAAIAQALVGVGAAELVSAG